MAGAGGDGHRRARLLAVASLLVGVAIGLVGNLATGTVQVEAWWWKPAVWTATGVLIVAAVLLG